MLTSMNLRSAKKLNSEIVWEKRPKKQKNIILFDILRDANNEVTGYKLREDDVHISPRKTKDKEGILEGIEDEDTTVTMGDNSNSINYGTPKSQIVKNNNTIIEGFLSNVERRFLAVDMESYEADWEERETQLNEIEKKGANGE